MASARRQAERIVAQINKRRNRMLEVRPTGAALGADIDGVDLSQALTSAEFGAIHAAWMRHLVLRFRGQRLTDAQLMTFSRNFGALDGNPRHAKVEGRDDDAASGYVNIISNVVENGRAIGGLGNYESKWHTDMSYNPVPPMASALYALEVPPSGGDTGFCNMYAALENLPAPLRARVDGLSCVHDSSLNSVGQLRVGFEAVTDPRRTPGAVHPLVRTHPVTGRKCLFLGRRRNAHVQGLDLAESETLLDALWSHATRPEHCWTQQWRVGDLVLWDNRCALHRRDEFEGSARRVMHRTQISGDRPF
jgi:taurine dioxygenase